MLLTIEVRGRDHLWSLELDQEICTPENLAAWQADGLNVAEVVHEVPATEDKIEFWRRGGTEQ